MRYGQVAGVGKPVSRLVLGTMVIHRGDRENSFRLLDAALRLGVTTFDLAHCYGGGETERCVGDWLADRGCRDRVTLATKGCLPNADRPRITPHDLESDLRDSLVRLRVPSVDLYFFHRDDPGAPVGPLVETLDRFRREGLLGAAGGSNWTHGRLREANRYAAERGLAPLAASSPNYGLAEQVEDPWGGGCVTIAGPGEAPARAWYLENRMPVFAYSSLGRGLFSGRLDASRPEEAAGLLDGAAFKAYAHPRNFERLRRVEEYARQNGHTVPQVALAWLLHQPLDVYPLVGAANPDELSALAEALSIRLSPGTLAHLDLAD